MNTRHEIWRMIAALAVLLYIAPALLLEAARNERARAAD